jgi:hypothetical protein
MIDEEASGNLAAALHREQPLLTLAKRHTEDPRTADIFRESAAKLVPLILQWKAGARTPRKLLSAAIADRRSQNRQHR